MYNKIRNKAIVLFLFFGVALFFSCSEESKSKRTSSVNPEHLKQGFQLLESNCFTCHSPDADMDSRIAPPMIAIKKHYIERGTGKEEFTNDLTAFINNPSEDISKMPGAVKKFGIMPKMIFPDSDIVKIAEYIYETELEAPGWFRKHYHEERKKHMKRGKGQAVSFVDKGRKIAMSTKGVLGKNLLSAINTKGTEEALVFCNERAYPLTDSMSVELGAKIKRVSDQPRNPKNVANESELTYIQKFKENLSKGEKTKPLVQEKDGKMVGYYPITTNKMCMQCHGQPEKQIEAKVLEKIDHLYPTDKAKGYDVDELRGIWVIEMDKD